jgi:hypothetical protein
MQMKLNVPKVFWVSATALACGLSMAFLGRPLLRGSQNKSLTASGPKVPSPRPCSGSREAGNRDERRQRWRKGPHLQRWRRLNR